MHSDFWGRCRKLNIFTFGLLLAVVIAAGSHGATRILAAGPGAPVINSFSVSEVSTGVWRLSGTVSSEEGIEGMVLYFGGSLIDETDAPDSNGAFSIDVTAEPQQGDWAEVYATDRWGMDSNTEVEYF